MTFNGESEIKTPDGTTLKEVVEFTYLSSNIGSTERDIEIHISKAWVALDICSQYGLQG